MTTLSAPRAKDGGLRDLAQTPRTWIDISLLVLLAAALRLTTLGLQSFEFDEGAALYVIRGSFTHALHGIARYESTPPLYYTVAWAWSQAFGTGEIGLRLLSGLAGVATVPLVYAIGRELVSRRIGLVAAAIVATNPYLVFYSQEARAYALLILLSTAATFFCVRVLQHRGRRNLTWWAVLSAGAIATHYFAVFPFVGQAAALALFGPRRFLGRAVVAVAVVCSPLVPLARHQSSAGHTSWIAAASLAQRLRVTAETFALGATFRGSLSHALLAVFGGLAALLAAAIGAGLFLLARRTGPDERRAAKIVGLIAGVTIGLPLLGALGPADYFLHKNVSPALPLLALVVAVGLGCRRAGKLGSAGAAAIVAVGVVLTLMSFSVTSLRRPDLRQVSRELGPPTEARILIFVPRWGILLQQYQGALPSLPAAGRRVAEIDAFTSSDSLPDGTVPPSFRLVRERRGNTFNLFTFRAPSPERVTPSDVARHTFGESGLQPVAAVQSP